MISFYIKWGYGHLFLHPDERYLFLFRYCIGYFRCVAILFGFGRSGYWIDRIMRPLLRHMPERLVFRFHPYIYYALVAPSRTGWVSTEGYSARGRALL